MRSEVAWTDSPERVLEEAGPFLQSDPIRHNVILTLLEARIAAPQPGNYWIVRLDGDVVGVALQSPTDFRATVTPMARPAVTALVEAIVDQGAPVPGVNGEAATIARFAGHWTERTRSAARPVEGERIYEVERVVTPTGVPGHVRAAERGDRDFVVASFEGFESETGDSGGHAPAVVADYRLRLGHLWVWDDGTPTSVAGLSEPVAGVVRVGLVYTPPDHRGRGYASALVAAVSKRVLDRGLRCILYTDLGNATSNAIYRAIGYHAVEEALRYEFSSPGT
jgi:predicted GNAT family acetyltransferase